MTVLRTHAGVDTGAEVGVTGVAGEALEPSGEAEPVALGDAAGTTDVLPGALVVALGGGLASEVVESLDALACDFGLPGHRQNVSPADGNTFRIRSDNPLSSSVGRVPVRALNYLEVAGWLDRSGIGTSVKHQRAALADTGVEVVTSPWIGDDPLSAAGSRLTGGRCFADVDLVHCNMIGPGTAATVKHARRTDTPVILHSHVTREDFRDSFRGANVVAPALGKYLEWFYSQADLVLCPSEYTKGVLQSYPIDAPIQPITNGIDLDRLTGHEDFREGYRERYDIDGMGVFAVGNVFERKGLSTFCRVAQKTDYDFTWFGTYETGPSASSAVRKWTKRPPANVTFSGWVDDIRGAYGAGDVFMFPAKVENQGIVVLEAMACGKACVVSDIPAFEEYYEDGHDCLICSTESEFVDALERLEANPELRERLGENAKETAREHGLDRVGDRLSDIYEGLIAGDVPPTAEWR